MNNIGRGRPPCVIELVSSRYPSPVSSPPRPGRQSPRGTVSVLPRVSGEMFFLKGGGWTPFAPIGISNIRRGHPWGGGEIVNTPAPSTGLRAPGSGLRAPGSGLRAPGSGLRAPGSVVPGYRNRRNGCRAHRAQSTGVAYNEKGPAWASPPDSGFCFRLREYREQSKRNRAGRGTKVMVMLRSLACFPTET
jgi:hypothetical protein